jgi:hypothetical protein
MTTTSHSQDQHEHHQTATTATDPATGRGAASAREELPAVGQLPPVPVIRITPEQADALDRAAARLRAFASALQQVAAVLGPALAQLLVAVSHDTNHQHDGGSQR